FLISRIYYLISFENLYIGRLGTYQFDRLNAIESVTIGRGAPSASGCFEDCPSLKKLIIADSDQELFLYNSLSFPGSPVEEIYLGRNVSFRKYSPFSSINTLTSAIVGNHVTILNDVFADCTSLRSIKFEDGAEMLYSEALENFRECPIETLYLGRNISGLSPFSDLATLSSVTVGNSVTTFERCAFSGCTALKSFTCSDSVKEIGELAFWNCTGLTSFDLGYSVANIGFSAFLNCSGLTSMVIPNSVTMIRGGVFNGCVSLKEVIIEDGDEILSWDNYSDRGHSFEQCPLESLYLGRYILFEKESPFYGVETLSSLIFGNNATSIPIPEESFKNCTGLTSVTISDSVTEIGKSAFSGCTSLISISIPNSVTTIEGWAFYNCSALTSVIIPKSLSKISHAVFSDCESLSSITIPNSVDSIDDYAFHGCISLKKLIIEDESKTLYLGQNEYEKVKGLFSGCPIETLYIGRNLSFPNNCSPFAEIETIDDVTFSNFVTIIENSILQSDSLKTINIPSSIKEIKKNAFCGCMGIEDVIVEDSLEPLNCNYNAMPSYSLKNLYIGRNIVGSPFKYCDELKDITFGNLVAKIDSADFASCMAIKNVIVLADNPPALDENGFEDVVYENAVLKVPDSSVKKYRITEGWYKFHEIMGINEERPTSLEIDNKEVNLLKGESIILNVIIAPENATNATISWSSSDPAVADVDANGLVTAIDRGSAIITASTTNGLTASCSVTVTSVLVESIQLTPENLNGEEGHFYKIEATLLPENAAEKTLIWSSSEESVATVNSEGVVLIHKEGECIITASASDGSGVTAECIVTGVAGIDSIFSDNINFDIYNVNGTLIRKGCDKNYLKTLAPDVYIIRQGNLTKKLIVH
ncbi:MAG: leucine-rich repeat protein, partial [Muribaculaceae bacterium]|nr:leucine-rich repeat protein [Muribaculaceae bacterium]